MSDTQQAAEVQANLARQRAIDTMDEYVEEVFSCELDIPFHSGGAWRVAIHDNAPWVELKCIGAAIMYEYARNMNGFEYFGRNVFAPFEVTP